MNIGGLQKTSLLDYPGKIAAIIWTVGCNFRCPFCYNPQLITGDTKSIPIQNVLDFLETRKGKLEAVSITGGEPLLHEDIESLIISIKEKGYLVKIDTNGSHPDRLNHLLQKNLLDYVSMDIKTSKEKYEKAILFSGDRDFKRCVVELQKRGKTVQIVSTLKTNPPMISEEFRNTADIWTELTDIITFINHQE